MRFRLVVTMRATALTSSDTPLWALPFKSSASAWNLIFCPLDTQPSVLMPATTLAGQSVFTLRRVCTSPLGSA
jgi:hypothetical protein